MFKHFFRNTNAGFSLESGGLDGSASNSNTLFFERFFELERHRRGGNCRLLRKRRKRVRIECSALCETKGWTSFSSDGGCCGRAGVGKNTVLCRRLSEILLRNAIPRLDFWSLDVEGGEEAALRGFNWTVPLHVLLIESVTPRIATLLSDNNFVRHAFASPSRLNQIWVNSSWLAMH